MHVQFDHAVIFVPDLKAAMANFENLGFTVTPGGEHEHTYNALIFFQDQTYIELLAVKPGWRNPLFRFLGWTGLLRRSANKRDDILWRLYRWVVARPGPIDWCVRVENMSNAENHLASLEIPIVKSQEFDRQRPDGKRVKWWLGSARDLDLPFMLTDITQVDLRVESGNAMRHANGATGIQRISVATENFSRTVSRLSGFLQQPISPTIDVDASFTLGNTELSVPEKFEHRGKFALEIACSRGERKQLAPDSTYGLMMWLVPKG